MMSERVGEFKLIDSVHQAIEVGASVATEKMLK
jgi:hypothetical protein